MEGKQQNYAQGEWLNLRLGRKVFTCKFCDREFHSSQALGGHQNAHRREKTMFAHCMAASGPSIGVQQPEPCSPAMAPSALREHPDFSWPGSSRREETLHPGAVDLDLKL